jgi:hypothetical protein
MTAALDWMADDGCEEISDRPGAVVSMDWAINVIFDYGDTQPWMNALGL